MQPQHLPDNPRGVFPLLVTTGIVLLLWLIVLPWIGSQPDVAARIEREQGEGTDPGAKFYPELGAMSRISRRADRRREERPRGFWRPGRLQESKSERE